MARLKIFEGNVERLEILDYKGRFDEKDIKAVSDETLLKLLELMIKMRMFDQKALNLQRQGRISTYGSLKGQEACQAGLSLNLKQGDFLVPSFREHGVMMSMGIPLHNILALWKGDERANINPEGVNCLPPSIPVGSQLLHATGLGMAFKMKDKDDIAVGFGGDGSSSQGDFHEAMNYASVFGAQTLFFIQNNGYAISLPFKKQTNARSIAQKALAYEMKAIQVDGNDVLAVYKASREAIDYIRKEKKPYLLECVTYRLENHTTSDDHTKYRSKEEIEFWSKQDPIERFKKFLISQGKFSDEKERELLARIQKWIEDEVEKLESMPKPKPTDIVDYVYSDLPWYLKEERELLEKEERSNG